MGGVDLHPGASRIPQIGIPLLETRGVWAFGPAPLVFGHFFSVVIKSSKFEIRLINTKYISKAFMIDVQYFEAANNIYFTEGL